MGHVLVWRGWTKWSLTPPIVIVAVGVVVPDVVAAWGDVSVGQVGPMAISPALPLALALALMLGGRSLGVGRGNLWAWREFFAVSGVVLVFEVVEYATQLGTPSEVLGLLVSSLDEELVYRVAVLIVVGAGCAALLGRDWRDLGAWGTGPGVAALLGSSVVFAGLPGHVLQMRGVLGAVPFMALGVVLAYVVLRTGALVQAMIVHVSVDLVTIVAYLYKIPDVWRLSFAATALVVLVAGTFVAGARLGMLRPVPVGTAARLGV